MANTRSFQDANKVTDWTEELLIIPNQWGKINEMGIFAEESVSQNTVTFEEQTYTIGLIPDQARGSRNNVSKDATRQVRTVAVPHFPHDDEITPQDLQGKRKYGSADEAETLTDVMQRKIERIRKSHALTLEYSRCKAIQGEVYAPNGTVSYNWYTEFGITRKEVDFDMDTSTTDVIAKGEEVIAHIQDNIVSGEIVTEIVALCSPEYFSRLIAHANVKEAYKYYASTQEILRQRAGGQGLFREFTFGGIRYIEYRGVVPGTATRLIPAGDAYFLPMGTSDMFVTYFAPANKFEFANTLGEQAYMFEYRDQRDERISIESESNFINIVRRPNAVVRGYTG